MKSLPHPKLFAAKEIFVERGISQLRQVVDRELFQPQYNVLVTISFEVDHDKVVKIDAILVSEKKLDSTAHHSLWFIG